jgi:hypothetical protein
MQGCSNFSRNRRELGKGDSQKLRVNWRWAKVGAVQFFYRRDNVNKIEKRAIGFENFLPLRPDFCSPV